ncbi:DUF4153 domain-containing protein [Sphingomonas sp. XXL09]|uniref:DUF4153 domain-containing protein n=1 Tax=Sphingomonas sp. XXL09 TaxID=3457787 RepID=UPI00406BD10F
MPQSRPIAARGGFLAKIAAAGALALVFDLVFFDRGFGATLGGFALAWCLLAAACVPALRRGAPLMALALAGTMALVLVDAPGPIAWCLFWTALASAALLPRHRFDDAARWATRLASQLVFAVPAPLHDAARAQAGRSGRAPLPMSLIVLPLAGGAVFLLLFALANPLIGAALEAIQPPAIDRLVGHAVTLAAIATLAWATLRPRSLRWVGSGRARPLDLALPLATLTVSLAVFNLVFAIQNALDLLFLWSGAPLPAGVTLAGYAHQGAYTLILVALLAAAFVTGALRPGSAAAASPAIRRLVLLWLAQTLLLVASSILRLLDYVDAYMLTTLRLAALVWMALVACGVGLIAWQWLARRSLGWLVNANALAALLVLAASTLVDYGELAAGWTVRHATRADQVDLAYLHDLGPSALAPLLVLERRAGPRLRPQVTALRDRAVATLACRQADWHRWTWRGARRLAAARAAIGRDAPPAPLGRDCGN